MKDNVEAMTSRARDCERLVADIDLIRPRTYEQNQPVEEVVEILRGAAALYELRFGALFAAYEVALGAQPQLPIEVGLEQSIMLWWGACDDLRCAAEGAKSGILDVDGIDNVLLGVRSMALVRAAAFHALLRDGSAGSRQTPPGQKRQAKAGKAAKAGKRGEAKRR